MFILTEEQTEALGVKTMYDNKFIKLVTEGKIEPTDEQRRKIENLLYHCLH